MPAQLPLQNTGERRGATILAQDFGWHHASRKEPALSAVNFSIRPGERVLLLGPSGAGKSTLLHAMGGLLHDEDGQSQQGMLTIDGNDPQDARGTVGLMQQDPDSSVVLARVGDDVAFGPENLGVPREQIWQRVGQALRAVGLEHLALDHSTSALSGGQKQRLGLAGILAMHPGALLLDEPTANLDPAGVLEVRDSVMTAQKLTGATLVVIEHRVSVWAEHMDRVIVVDRGTITHDGTPQQVLRDAREQLIDAGVWVPDFVPPIPGRKENAGVTLLCADDVSVSRQYPSRAQLRQRTRDLKAGLSPVLPLPAVAQNISLDVCAGEHLAILGPNGAGKSTLALTLAGLLVPVQGQISATPELMGDLLSARKSATVPADIAGWRAADIATRIGLVFQEPEQQFIKATVRDELEFGPRHIAKVQKTPLDESKLQTTVDNLLERLRLTQLQDANPFTLSGGEKRRLSVATALATAPKILMLDEPTFGQDANTWRELVLLIRELMDQGISVVSVTHDQDFVNALGGHTITLAPHHEEAA